VRPGERAQFSSPNADFGEGVQTAGPVNGPWTPFRCNRFACPGQGSVRVTEEPQCPRGSITAVKIRLQIPLGDWVTAAIIINDALLGISPCLNEPAQPKSDPPIKRECCSGIGGVSGLGCGSPVFAQDFVDATELTAFGATDAKRGEYAEELAVVVQPPAHGRRALIELNSFRRAKAFRKDG
jgi:hypothetical protein